jgi:hypothetical protein
MSEALVLGNGESRCCVDLNLLKDKFAFIGCNGIHRDITVDHLICCDQRMIVESLKNESTKNSLIYVRAMYYRQYRKIQKQKNVRLLPEVPTTGQNKRDDPTHWGSGPYAVLVASVLGFQNITLLGFDLYGNKEKVNNIYKNTTNYSKGDTRAVDHSFWLYQIQQVFLTYPETNYKIVNISDWAMPSEWKKDNITFENIDSFRTSNNQLTVL